MINNIKRISIYENNYRSLRVLSEKDAKDLSYKMLKYIFEDIEPDNLTIAEEDVWCNLKLAIDKSKTNVLNGLKGGKPTHNPTSNPNTNPTDNRIDIANTKPNNTFRFYIYNFNFLKDKRLLREKIEEWLKYKEEIKNPYKSETGFKSLLTQIKNNCEKYGENNVINLIDECMASNYKGIIFDRLKKYSSAKRDESVPSWFNKNLVTEKISTEEQEELDKILNEMEEQL